MSSPAHASDRTRIRALFLRHRGSYSLADAATLLRMEPEAVRAAIAEAAVDPGQFEGEMRLTWEEVVTLGVLRRWTPRILSGALPADVVPRLVRGARRRVELPRYLWELLGIVAMERAADEERDFIVSDVIEDVLHQTLVASITDWEPLEEQVSGVRAAAEWPMVW